jgi:hypothetical protein
MYEGYLELGGAEVLNSARAVGYTTTAPTPIMWLQCPPCDGIRDVLGDDAYTYETIADAPWYDDQLEQTHRFYGAHALSVEGLPDSTRDAGVAEGIGDGGVVGRVRRGTRRMRYRVILTAKGEDALETGFDWLNQVLSPSSCGAHGDACGAADMRFYTACPPERADITMPETFWNDPAENFMTNPAFRAGGPAVWLEQNLANNPSWEHGGGPVTVRRNLVTNPSFEAAAGTVEVRRNLALTPQNDGGVPGWNFGRRWFGPGTNTGTFSTIPALITEAPGITGAARKTWSDASSHPQDISWGTMTARVPVVAGETYTVSFYIRPSWNVGTPMEHRFSFGGYDAESGGNLIQSIEQPNGVLPAMVQNVWTRLSYTLTVAAGVTWLSGGHTFYSSNIPANWPTPGHTLDVTGLLVEKSAVLGTYFDGSTLPAGDFSHAWTGTANASASIRYAPAVAGSGTVSASANVQSSEWASTGTKSLRVIAKPGDAFVEVNYPVSPGRTYTAMLTTRVATPWTSDGTSALLASSSWGAYAYFWPGGTVLQGVQTWRLTLTIDPADTTTHLKFILRPTSIPGEAGSLWYDNLLLVEGEYTGPYFDGSNPAKVRRNVALNPAFENWNGQPPASFGSGLGTSTLVPGEGRNGFPLFRKEWTQGAATFDTGYFDFGGVAGPGNTNFQAPIYGGRRYTASVWFRSNRSATFRYLAVEHAADGNQGVTNGPDIVVPANTWTRLYYTGIPAWDRTGQRASIILSDGPLPLAGDRWEISQAMVEYDVSTPGEYFDGRTGIFPYAGAWEGGAGSSQSYLYDSDFTYGWDGTVNASTSQQKGDYVSAADSANQGTSVAVVVRSTQWSSNRSHSLRIVPTGLKSPGGTDTGATVAGNVGSMSGYGVTFVAGRTYTISAKIRLLAPQTGEVNIRARRIHFADDIRGWEDPVAMSPQAPNVAGVHQLTLTVTVSATATWAILRLYNGATQGNDVWWDDLIIEESTVVRPYFDGSQPQRKLRRNIAVNPDSSGPNGFSSNSGDYWPVTKNVPVPAPHPQGITVAAKSTKHPEFPHSAILGMYNVDGWMNAGPERWIGAWFYVTVPGYRVYWNDTPVTPLPANTWLWVAKPNPVAVGQFSGVWVEKADGSNADSSAVAYITGVTASTEAMPTEAVMPGIVMTGAAPVGQRLDGAWEGTAKDSASYAYDPDFTYSWTGTADLSSSVKAGVRISPEVAVWSGQMIVSKHHGMRMIQVSATPRTMLQGIPVTLPAGAQYTMLTRVTNKTGRALARVRPGTGFQGSWNEFPMVEDQVAEFRFLVDGAAGANTVMFGTEDGVDPQGELWFKNVLLTAGSYDADYFDGSLPDSPPGDHEVPGTIVREYSWTGTPDASTSLYRTGSVVAVPDPVAYQSAVDRLTRHLHTVTCVSGPIVEQKLHRGDTWGYIVEFVLVAAVPWQFGVTRPVDLTNSIPEVVQDVPFNLVPYPSAELESGTVIAAKNFVTNPSAEVNATGWRGSGNRAPQNLVQTNELASAGTYSVKGTYTAPGTDASAGQWMGLEQVVAIPVATGTRVSINLWASASVQSGTAVLGTIEYVMAWFNGATFLSETTFGTNPASGGAKSVKSVLPPAGTTEVWVRAKLNLTSFQSGAVIRLYADAAAVTVP